MNNEGEGRIYLVLALGLTPWKGFNCFGGTHVGLLFKISHHVNVELRRLEDVSSDGLVISHGE